MFELNRCLLYKNMLMNKKAEERIVRHQITISSDGYIRLTFDEFRKISVVHLVSGLDDNPPLQLQNGATYTQITGYTEWISETTPAVSIGWDWILQSIPFKDILYRRISEPRCNLMLIDSQRHDFGELKTATLIETVIDEIAWENIVQDYIKNRYSS